MKPGNLGSSIAIVVAALAATLVCTLPAAAESPQDPGYFQLNDATHRFRDHIAFPATRVGPGGADETMTIVSFTSEPIDREEVGRILQIYGNWSPPEGANLELWFRADGSLHVLSFTDGERQLIHEGSALEVEVTLQPGTVAGTARTDRPAEIYDGEFELSVRFDTRPLPGKE